MTSQEKENWQNVKTLRLTIGEQYHHHYSKEIISANPWQESGFVEALARQITIEPRIKRAKSTETKAIKADPLNKEIRRLLLESKLNKNLRLEVSEEKGVFYFSEEKGAIGGFDFAIINHVRNLKRLHNLCFGPLRYADGGKRWDNFIRLNPELAELAHRIESTEAFNVIESQYEAELEIPPLIVGEIQFGNWALAYRDFFKVLKANVSNSIDCLIYIVPTGGLEGMLSDGIVTYSKAKAILQEFEKVISVPVWLIGLDIEE